MAETNDVNELLTLVRMDIRELTTEVRNIKDMQAMVINHNTQIAKNEDKTNSAHKRIDKIDRNVNKLVWLVMSTLIVVALNFMIKGGN